MDKPLDPFDVQIVSDLDEGCLSPRDRCTVLIRLRDAGPVEAHGVGDFDIPLSIKAFRVEHECATDIVIRLGHTLLD